MMKLMMMGLMLMSLPVFAIVSDPAESEENQAGEETEQYTILTGRLLKQEYIPDVQRVSCQQPGKLCWSVYYAYTIQVEDVISGEPLSGEVRVINYQHAGYIFRSSQLAVFVISRIEDEHSIKLLGSPYFVEEFSQVKASYCLSQDLRSYNAMAEEDERCFSLWFPKVDDNQITDAIRWDILGPVFENTESYLDEKKLLKEFIPEYSDGEKMITMEDHEEKHGYCDHNDVDMQDKDPSCDISQYLGFYGYRVNKGHAEVAMKYFKQQLASSKLVFAPTDFRYQIVEHDEYSEFQIHTKF